MAKIRERRHRWIKEKLRSKCMRRRYDQEKKWNENLKRLKQCGTTPSFILLLQVELHLKRLSELLYMFMHQLGTCMILEWVQFNYFYLLFRTSKHCFHFLFLFSEQTNPCNFVKLSNKFTPLFLLLLLYIYKNN